MSRWGMEAIEMGDRGGRDEGTGGRDEGTEVIEVGTEVREVGMDILGWGRR